MITQENIKPVLEDLTVEQLNEFLEQDKDCVCIILNIFNGGFNTTLKFSTFLTDFQEDLDNGNVSMDRDEFMGILNFYEISNWKKVYS